MVIQTGYRWIVRDYAEGEPYIKGTRFTVSHIANDLSDKLSNDREFDAAINGWLEMFPGCPKSYISKKKILSALDYYSTNRQEIDRFIEESKKRAGKIIRTGPPRRIHGWIICKSLYRWKHFTIFI